MHRTSAFVTALCLTVATPVLAQTAPPANGCDNDDYLEAAMAHLESHYRSFPEELFTAQLLMREGMNQADIKPDGAWGPKTQNAVCTILQQYTTIGGTDGDWGIKRASHGPQFTDWLLKAARSNLSEGKIEFPD